MATFRKRGKKWEYRIRYVDKTTGKKREISKGGFDSKKKLPFMLMNESANYFTGWLRTEKNSIK